MFRLVTLIIALVLSSDADAATRSYSFPEETNRIGTCLADGTSCGKRAADAFCRTQGFTESVLFARQKSTSARVLDSDKICEGETCEAFVKIKCYQPLEAAASN